MIVTRLAVPTKRPTKRVLNWCFIMIKFGSLVAAGMQTYLPTRILTTIGHNSVTAILIMMLLAFILSLCSEADAFIGASLLSSFGVAPTVAFLIIGPMVDIKNLIMMKHQFKTRFVGLFVGTASLVTIIYCLLLGVFSSYLGILSWSCTYKFLASSTSTLISTTPTWLTFPWCSPSSSLWFNSLFG